jgi:hypothetical protein
MMAFEGKMTTGDKVNTGIGHIALEGIGSGRDERRVILTPYGQQWWLVITQLPQPVRVAVATAAISMMFIIFIIELLCHLLNSMIALTSLPIDRETMMPSAIL